MMKAIRLAIAFAASAALVASALVLTTPTPAAAANTTLYVSPVGDDANSGLSPASAFATIQHSVEQLEAGDTLVVLDGEYQENVVWDARSSTLPATSTNRIIIRNDTGTQPTLKGSLTLQYASYWTVDGLKFEGPSATVGHVVQFWGGWSWELKNSEICCDNDYALLSVGGAPGGQAEPRSFRIHHNYLHSNGSGIPAQFHHIYIQAPAPSDGSWSYIERNTFHSASGGDNIHLGHHNSHDIGNLVVRNNTAVDGWWQVRLIDGVSNVVVEDNLLVQATGDLPIGVRSHAQSFCLTGTGNVVRNNVYYTAISGGQTNTNHTAWPLPGQTSPSCPNGSLTTTATSGNSRIDPQLDNTADPNGFRPSTPTTQHVGRWAPFDHVLLGDWNGDGTDTPGGIDNNTVYLTNDPSTPVPGWHSQAGEIFNEGSAGDLYIAGDWNGDGADTVGVFRPSTRTFYVADTNGDGYLDPITISGVPGGGTITPVAGNWDGIGGDSIGIRRNHEWHLRNTNSTGPADVPVFGFGSSAHYAVVGDWDGNGTDTPGARINTNNQWHLINQLATPGPNQTTVIPYGSYTDTTLVTGDWNGDGIDQPGVVRDLHWHIRTPTGGTHAPVPEYDG